MKTAIANCARISWVSISTVRKSCWRGNLPDKAAASCRSGGAWRLADVRNAKPRHGPWQAGGSHRTGQTCVSSIDLDINIHVRKLR